MTYKLPRAKCPYCGFTKSVTKDNRMRKHTVGAGVRAGKQCGGSGQRAGV